MFKGEKSHEIIKRESEKAGIEKSFIKFKGKDLIPTSDYSNSGQGYTNFDIHKISKLIAENNGRGYTIAHTHIFPDVLPSVEDMTSFLATKGWDGNVIVQVDNETGDEEGRLYLRKTSKTPNTSMDGLSDSPSSLLSVVKRLAHPIKIVRLGKAVLKYKELIADKSLGRLNGFEEFCGKYHIQYKFVPAKGYKRKQYAREIGFFADDPKIYLAQKDLLNKAHAGDVSGIISKHSLESKFSATTAIISLLGGILFLSSNVTGRVISNISNSTSNWIGIILFIFGIIAAFVHFKFRNNMH